MEAVTFCKYTVNFTRLQSVTSRKKMEFFTATVEFISFPLMTEAEISSEDVITFYKITQCHIPEKRNVHNYRDQNLTLTS
jgi:hypothetical protein